MAVPPCPVWEITFRALVGQWVNRNIKLKREAQSMGLFDSWPRHRFIPLDHLENVGDRQINKEQRRKTECLGHLGKKKIIKSPLNPWKCNVISSSNKPWHLCIYLFI